jgi:hypothetical protein
LFDREPFKSFSEKQTGISAARRQCQLYRAMPSQAQVLLAMSRSVIVHIVVPGGACNEAVPLLTAASTRPITRRSVAL